MVDTAYAEAVKETFETKPLKTVLLIDDEFPTFSDLARGKTEDNENKFAQKDRALNLYEGFHKRHMICDFENRIDELEIERFRKSDLIVLDYHLRPGEDDNELSIEILRKLSSTKHFNTVIVYTAETNLDGVWLDIMASLSGGWTAFIPKLQGEVSEHWVELSDNDKLPIVHFDAVMQYARRKKIRDIEPSVLNACSKELEEVGVPRALCNGIIEAIIHRKMSERAGKYADELYHPTVGDYHNGVYWIQTRNTFVTILKKDDEQDHNDKSEKLMSRLYQALLAWHPNLFQILVSEIQNTLELEALATADKILSEPTTHTALWYYLLETLANGKHSSDPEVKAPLMNIIDKIVDGIRRRLSTDDELLNLASGVLLGELKDTFCTNGTWSLPDDVTMATASEIARTKGLVERPDVFFRLNGFFSTEIFGSAHLTTGTICFLPESNEYFVTASPACDLVARKPRIGQKWAHAIHPLTPVVVIYLQPVRLLDSALTKATRAQHIFLEHGGENKAFKIVNDDGQPSYEILFAESEGRVHKKEGKTVFEAVRLYPDNTEENDDNNPSEEIDDEHTLLSVKFEVIGQLRNIHATHVLQIAGQHLSRIGLDFVNMPGQ